jgi:4-alpha-glucanotransferase
LIQSPGVQKEISALRNAELVEYERVYALKLRFLKLLFEAFLKEWRDGTPRAADFKRYIEREGDLLDRFAVHSALDQTIHKKCPDVWNWKAGRSIPGSRFHRHASIRAKTLAQRSVLQVHPVAARSAARRRPATRYRARPEHRAISRPGAGHRRFGSDLWAHREFFVAGCRVGAPPDGFSPKGQDWGFPPPNSDRHVEDGYCLFAESIRKNCRHGGALRIDHVMRFFRLYWIPDGMEATEGTYVRDRFEALLSILALESVRNQVIVIGEDLGTVPDEAREVLHRFGILSYRLLYFEQNNDGRFRPPQEYPRDALVSATTHDLPTLAGFWTGRDIEARREAGLLSRRKRYQSMRADRAREKQKLLDLLTGLKLLPDWFPRDASQSSRAGWRAAQRHRRLSQLHAFQAHGAESGRPAEAGRAAKPAGEHRGISQLAQKNEVHDRGAVDFREIRDFALMFRSWLEQTGRLNQAK